MRFYQHPEAFCNLRQFYWHLRSRRAFDLAARQRWYRRIRAERQRLVELGYSVEHLRLYCRWLSNPLPDSPALRRLQSFEAMLIEFARIQQAASRDLRNMEGVPVVVQQFE